MTHGPPPEATVALEGVSKSFRLPHEHVHTLKERALHPLTRRQFEKLRALEDVSLEVRAGEFFGIVGRNGSGKTTLMKCIAGIYGADAGEIWVRGRLAPFIELGVGFNPDLTARDNVLINAIVLGLSPAEARERYDAIIEFAELGRFVDLKLKNYSSGMHVRLAFAVMVHVDADVLLIDEVLAVGDSAFQRKCHDALLAAREAGRTILLVTHDMNAVQRFCDRAMLLDDGRMLAEGDPRAVARRYEEVNLGHGRALPSGPGAHLGDGSAVIADVWFEDDAGTRGAVLPHGRPCRMCMAVDFRAEARDPSFGFVITDERSRLVFAATSEWRNRHTGHFGAGERVEVGVRFENRLAAGRYFLSPEVSHFGSSRRLMDHREETAELVVTGGREGAGVVDLPHDFEIRPSGTRAEPTEAAQ